MSAPDRIAGDAPGAAQGVSPANPAGTAGANGGPQAAGPASPWPADLAQLFRHALREGRIHPLMPLVLRYRQALAAAASADPAPPADKEAR